MCMGEIELDLILRFRMNLLAKMILDLYTMKPNLTHNNKNYQDKGLIYLQNLARTKLQRQLK